MCWCACYLHCYDNEMTAILPSHTSCHPRTKDKKTAKAGGKTVWSNWEWPFQQASCHYQASHRHTLYMKRKCWKVIATEVRYKPTGSVAVVLNSIWGTSGFFCPFNTEVGQTNSRNMGYGVGRWRKRASLFSFAVISTACAVEIQDVL